jgi:hypothetical protein
VVVKQARFSSSVNQSLTGRSARSPAGGNVDNPRNLAKERDGGIVRSLRSSLFHGNKSCRVGIKHVGNEARQRVRYNTSSLVADLTDEPMRVP